MWMILYLKCSTTSQQMFYHQPVLYRTIPTNSPNAISIYLLTRIMWILYIKCSATSQQMFHHQPVLYRTIPTNSPTIIIIVRYPDRHPATIPTNSPTSIV